MNHQELRISQALRVANYLSARNQLAPSDGAGWLIEKSKANPKELGPLFDLLRKKSRHDEILSEILSLMWTLDQKPLPSARNLAYISVNAALEALMVGEKEGALWAIKEAKKALEESTPRVEVPPKLL
jgi:hypothetical protein